MSKLSQLEKIAREIEKCKICKKDKIGKASSERRYSDITKRNMSFSKLGANNPMFGKKPSC